MHHYHVWHHIWQARNCITIIATLLWETVEQFSGYIMMPIFREPKFVNHKWAPPSEFVSSIPTWQILTAHAQPFRGARDLAFCLKVPLDSLFVWASSEGSGETCAWLAWTFAARIGDKYQIRLTRSKWYSAFIHLRTEITILRLHRLMQNISLV